MKYIDADLLKRKLKDVATEFKTGNYYLDNSEQAVGYENALIDFEQIIDSLQQEQLPGIEEHGIPGKDFIPVEWVDACEKYGKWKIVQREQPSDDLEEAARNVYESWMGGTMDDVRRDIVELGKALNARKEEKK